MSTCTADWFGDNTGVVLVRVRAGVVCCQLASRAAALAHLRRQGSSLPDRDPPAARPDPTVSSMPQLGMTCHTSNMDATLVLGKQGRLVIPAEVRLALGLAPGDQLHLHVAGSRLVLERPQDAVDQLRALARDVSKSRSLVDELLAERRVAATAE